MKASSPKLSLIILWLLLVRVGIVSTGCADAVPLPGVTQAGEEQRQGLAALGLGAATASALLSAGAGDSAELGQARRALEAWQVGLEQGLKTAGARDLTPGFAFSPQNWMAVTGDDCQDVGTPQDLQGSGCPFRSGSSVIGVCLTRFTSTGRIVDTTFLVRKSFLNGPASESERMSVLIHEIGHCIGLAHSGSRRDVMFANTSGADLPSMDELASVASAYSPTRNPSHEAFRFSTTSGGAPLRHFSAPAFVLSAVNSGGLVERPARGQRLTAPVQTRIQHAHGAKKQ